MHFAQFKRGDIIQRTVDLHTDPDTIAKNVPYLFIGVLNGCAYLTHGEVFMVKLVQVDDDNWTYIDIEDTNLFNFKVGDIVTRIEKIRGNNVSHPSSLRYIGYKCVITKVDNHPEAPSIELNAYSTMTDDYHILSISQTTKEWMYGWALYKDPLTLLGDKK